MEITPVRTDKRRLFARWFTRRLLSLVWYLFDCDDECNYCNH